MKLNEHAMSEHLKAFGAAFVGAMLCVSMTALSTGSVVAHAEQGSDDEATAVPAATENVPVGWYATVTSPTSVIDVGTNDYVLASPGLYARSSSGWIDLSQYGVWISGGAAYINETNLPALQSAISLPSSQGGAADGIAWWQLYKVVTVADVPLQPEVTENKGTDTKSPEKDWSPDVSNTEGLPPVPEVTQKPAEPTPVESADPAPQEVVTNNQNAPTVESGLLSLQCRESEAAAKIAELEAQGYEIVRVEKLPKWWR